MAWRTFPVRATGSSTGYFWEVSRPRFTRSLSLPPSLGFSFLQSLFPDTL